MSELQLSPGAESDLDDIWLHIARETGSIQTADRILGRITERFWLLARYPYLGRSRDWDLRPGLRSLPVDDYLVIYRVTTGDAVLILHVVHGRRDLEAVLG